MIRQRQAAALSALVSLTGLIIIARSLSSLEWIGEPLVLALGAAFAGINLMGYTLRTGVRVSAAYPLIVAATVTAGAPVAILMVIVGVSSRMFIRREDPSYVLFSTAQLAIAVLVAERLFYATGGTTGWFELPWDALRFMVAAVAFDLTNLAVAQAQLTLREGGDWLRRWYASVFRDGGWILPVHHALSLITVLLIQAYGTWGLAVACVPVISLHSFLRLQGEASEARRMAHTDRLTGIGNYQRLTAWLADDFPAIANAGRQVAAMWIDVDGLKLLNDAHGHEAGNLALKSLAGVLESSTRHTDLVLRYGGDEFVILLPDTGAEAADAVRLRITEAVAQLHLTYRDRLLPLGLSIGAAVYPDEAASAQDLLRASDTAMLEVKRRKRRASAEGQSAL